ncbi:hypothetical protein ACVIM9_007213 [Bradyrhizobium sp. USDA 4520]
MEYSIFDSFLGVDTWHTNHDNDKERFYNALRRALTNPDFNPDAMGNYMRAAKAPPAPKSLAKGCRR